MRSAGPKVEHSKEAVRAREKHTVPRKAHSNFFLIRLINHRWAFLLSALQEHPISAREHHKQCHWDCACLVICKLKKCFCWYLDCPNSTTGGLLCVCQRWPCTLLHLPFSKIQPHKLFCWSTLFFQPLNDRSLADFTLLKEMECESEYCTVGRDRLPDF